MQIICLVDEKLHYNRFRLFFVGLKGGSSCVLCVFGAAWPSSSSLRRQKALFGFLFPFQDVYVG